MSYEDKFSGIQVQNNLNDLFNEVAQFLSDHDVQEFQMSRHSETVTFNFVHDEKDPNMHILELEKHIDEKMKYVTDMMFKPLDMYNSYENPNSPHNKEVYRFRSEVKNRFLSKLFMDVRKGTSKLGYFMNHDEDRYQASIDSHICTFHRKDNDFHRAPES